MSIFDAFLNKISPAPAPAQAQQQQQQLQGTQSPPAPQNPPVHLDPSQPNQQSQLNGAAPTNATVNPLDQFQSLWAAPKPPENGAPAAQTQAVAFDQAAMQQQLQGMDFMKSVNPADMQAIAAGGPEAVTAMSNMMNTVMRQAMLVNTGFAAQSANRAAEFAYGQAQAKVPELIRGQMTQNEFAAPEHNHPALQPMIQALNTQFQSQYPKASPAEIAAHVRTYLGTVGGVFAPKQEAAAGKQNAPQAQDWNSWFTPAGR